MRFYLAAAGACIPRQEMTMNIPTKLSIVLAAILMLDGASAVVAKTVAKTHHYLYAPDRARAAYGARPEVPYAGVRRYARPPINECRLRWGERPEELFQDIGYQQSLGYDC
jgi:hypothetical protein